MRFCISVSLLVSECGPILLPILVLIVVVIVICLFYFVLFITSPNTELRAKFKMLAGFVQVRLFFSCVSVCGCSMFVLIRVSMLAFVLVCTIEFMLIFVRVFVFVRMFVLLLRERACVHQGLFRFVTHSHKIIDSCYNAIYANKLASSICFCNIINVCVRF